MAQLNHDEVVDILYRSRITLLEHLENMGYDTKPYSKFSPSDISEMTKALGPPPKTANPTAPPLTAPALQMNLKRRDDYKLEEGEPSECLIVYSLLKMKQKIVKFTNEIMFAKEEAFMNPATTELIVMTMEPIVPNFHAYSAKVWYNHSARVRYFQAACFIHNPLNHILVPKHEKLSKDDEEKVLKDNYARKSQFPLIRYHEDPIARLLGLMPKDMVKITRPSATSGECVIYRVCIA
jgi:DNA-directed RNA polymerase subunit H